MAAPVAVGCNFEQPNALFLQIGRGCSQTISSVSKASARVSFGHLHMNVRGCDHVANEIEQTAHGSTDWNLKLCC